MKNLYTQYFKIFHLISAIAFIPNIVSAAGDLFVSGITSPSSANGQYIWQGTHAPSNKDYWKHATQNFYIYYDEYLTTGSFNWNIDDDLVDDANVLFFSNVNPDPSSPVLVTSWTGINGSGSPVVTNYVPIGPPTIITSAVTLINATSANMGGNVTLDGGSPVTETGVVYSSTNATPEIGGADVTQNVNGSGTGAFVELISPLTNGTTYYFQAYATNSSGTSYGGVKTVTPGVIDFELTGYSDGTELGKSVAIHGFTFAINSVDPADDIIFDNEDPAGTGSGALWDDNLNTNDISMWSISKADGSEFQLKSLLLKQAGAGSTSGTISARKNGSQVGASIPVTFNGNTSYLLESNFKDIDEIRIQATDLYIFIDDLLFKEPIVTYPPTLTAFSGPIKTTPENTEVEITFADLKNAGNEADTDGTVDAFIIKAVSTGSLKIGANAGSATAFNATTNKTVNASNNAYWTPALNVAGLQNAFTTTVLDNDLLESSSPVQATIFVGIPRFIGPGTSFADAANWESGAVPDQNLDIIIAAGQVLEVNMDYTCKTLKFEDGASFRCINGKILSITGNILNKLGEVKIDVNSALQVSSSIVIAN